MTNRLKANQATKRYWKRNPDKLKKKKKRWSQKRKLIVLSHYSERSYPECACCGETHIEFLCLDHINNDGNIERKKLGSQGSGTNFYAYLKKRNYPEGYQVLCFNCNCAKAFYGKCPHREEQHESK